MKVKKVAKKLERAGWLLSRTRGSHRQFKHPNRKELVTLSGKLSGDVPNGTLHSIFKLDFSHLRRSRPKKGIG